MPRATVQAERANRGTNRLEEIPVKQIFQENPDPGNHHPVRWQPQTPSAPWAALGRAPGPSPVLPLSPPAAELKCSPASARAKINTALQQDFHTVYLISHPLACPWGQDIAWKPPQVAEALQRTLGSGHRIEITKSWPWESRMKITEPFQWFLNLNFKIQGRHRSLNHTVRSCFLNA